MAFGLLWSLLWPLLVAALRTILPWLIDRLTQDIKAGRTPVVSDEEIRYALTSHKAAIQASYRAGSEARKFAAVPVESATASLLQFQRDEINQLRTEVQELRDQNVKLLAKSF